MRFAYEVAQIKVCGQVFRRGNNTIITPSQYATFRRHNGHDLSFYNNTLFDLTDYAKRASKEIGNKLGVGHKEEPIIQKYVQQAIKDIKTGKLKPVNPQPDLS